ncbi:MAG: tetratricopeptide repeat protein [Deltaproteobacteria bacterium]|nr:tetratricopeptide repeat protein [Candidatus Anaeroferrophillacea bacterium]
MKVERYGINWANLDSIMDADIDKTRHFPPLLLFLLLFLLPPRPAAAAAERWVRELPPAVARVVAAAQELAGKGNEREAVARLAQVRQPNGPPRYVLVELLAGNLAFMVEDYAAAAAAYERVLHLAPDHAGARENLAMALMAGGEYAAAAPLFLCLANGTGQDLAARDRFLGYAGSALLHAGDYRAALVPYRELTVDRPVPDPGHLRALLRIYLELEEYPAAEAAAARLVNLRPDDAAGWRALGQVRLQRQRYGAALAAYAVLRELGAASADELGTLARLYQHRGVPLAAARILAESFTGAATLEPRQYDLLVGLYAEGGETDAALRWLERRQREHSDPAAFMRRGDLLYRVGRYAEALAAYRQVEKLPGDNGRQFLMAAYSAWYLNDHDLTRMLAERARRHDASRPGAVALLAALDRLRSE